MKFLTKLGQILLKGTELLTGFLPLISRVTQDGAPMGDDLRALGKVIADVEVMGQLLGHAGPDKLKIATALARQIILQSDLLSGQSVANATLFEQGVEKIAGGVADVLNSLKDQIDTEQVIAP